MNLIDVLPFTFHTSKATNWLTPERLEWIRHSKVAGFEQMVSDFVNDIPELDEEAQNKPPIYITIARVSSTPQTRGMSLNKQVLSLNSDLTYL